MTQKEINLLFELTIMVHEQEWFGPRKKRRNREEVQEWVAKQLADSMEIYTTPCGSCWGILVTQEEFNEYWKEHSKIGNIT